MNDHELDLLENEESVFKTIESNPSNSRRRESLNLAPSPTLYNVSLAEAENLDEEEDEIDLKQQQVDMEFMDNEANTRSSATEDALSSSSSTSCDLASHTTAIAAVAAPPPVAQIINNFEKQATPLPPPPPPTTTNSETTKLTVEERVSADAKEYWATIDFYNSSKLAFSKRCRSVKANRQMIDDELKKRQHQLPQPQQATSTHTTHDQQPCTCVQCSIAYHETVIKSLSTSSSSTVCVTSSKNSNTTSNNQPGKPNETMLTASASNSSCSIDSSVSSSSSAHLPLPTTTAISVLDAVNVSAHSSCSSSSEEFSQFDEKLFSIKNELVILSFGFDFFFTGFSFAFRVRF